MKHVNYILVHETDSKNAACDVTYRDVPYIGLCVVCDTSSMFKVKGSSERQALISELCRWRNHWPEAPILGVSELDVSASHAPTRVNPEMNALRRELSDLP